MNRMTARRRKIFVYLLVIAFICSFMTVCVYADDVFSSYSIISQPEGVELTSLGYSNGYINVAARLEAGAFNRMNNSVTLVALKPGGEPCAILEDKADSEGMVGFSFALDTSEVISGEYTVKLSGKLTETLTAKLTVFGGLNDSILYLNAGVEAAETLIAECEDENIPVKYEKMYISVVKRSIELMREEGMYSNYISHSLTQCTNILNEAYKNLEGYLDGSITPKSVPDIRQGTVAVSGKKLVASVSENGVESIKPVFLNGYNIGWEDKDDSGFLNKIGANVYPYVLNINRVIGRPNTAYGWTSSLSGGGYGTVFASEPDGSLKIYSTGEQTGTLYQLISFSESETYTVRFKAKGNPSGNVFVKIGLSGETDAEWHVSKSSAWKSYEYTFNPSSSYRPELRIICSGIVGGLYIDDVSVTDSLGNELVTNGNFNEWFDSGASSESGLFGVNSFAVNEGTEAVSDLKEKGYSVILSGGFAAMPTYVTEMNGVKDAGASYGAFFSYNPTHPKILEAIKTYIDAVIPAVGVNDNIVCFMIHNEPTFNSYGKSFYNDKWAQYLENKYVSIANLNLVYGGTTYADFASVPMQNNSALTTAQKFTKQFYDWRVFNDSIISEYHTSVAAFIKANAPSMKVGTKIMQETSPKAAFIQHYGTDYESFGALMDINANDSWARPDTDWQPIAAQLMWYDYLLSVKNAPVFNLENHFSLDSSSLNYSADYANQVTAMLWQGALHGLSESQMWLWGRSDGLYPQYINPTIQYRPDVMKQIGKTGFDLNRLAEEIDAFREKNSEIAILFSETSRSYNRQYENALYKTYTAMLYSGAKADFVLDSNIDKLYNYNVLVIPEATHVSDEVLDEIYEFSLNGGKVLMLADDCLKYNENGEMRTNLEKVNAVKSAGAVESGGTRQFTSSSYSSVTDIEGKVKTYLRENGLSFTELTDENGNGVTGVEISSVETEEKTMINLCNYAENEKTVYIKYKGQNIYSMTNPLDGTEIYDGAVTLKPNVPVLLAIADNPSFAVKGPVFDKVTFEEGAFSSDGEGGSVITSDIKTLTAGYVSATADIYNYDGTDKLFFCLALKNGGRLKKVFVTDYSLSYGKNTVKVAADVTDIGTDDYLELYAWKGMKPCKIKSSLWQSVN